MDNQQSQAPGTQSSDVRPPQPPHRGPGKGLIIGIVVLVIVIIAAAGYLYEASLAAPTTSTSAPSSSTSVSTTSSSTTTSVTTTSTPPPTNSMNYSNSTTKISFTYPSSWGLHIISSDYFIYNTSSNDVIEILATNYQTYNTSLQYSYSALNSIDAHGTKGTATISGYNALVFNITYSVSGGGPGQIRQSTSYYVNATPTVPFYYVINYYANTMQNYTAHLSQALRIIGSIKIGQ